MEITKEYEATSNISDSYVHIESMTVLQFQKNNHEISFMRLFDPYLSLTYTVYACYNCAIYCYFLLP